MAVNQTGIAIVIKAFLPIGKDLDEQLAALTLVKTAHETSDYSALLAAAHVDDVKTEQKTRRVDENVKLTPEQWGLLYRGIGERKTSASSEIVKELDTSEKILDLAIATPYAPTDAEPEQTAMPVNDDEVPAFLKKAKAKAA